MPYTPPAPSPCQNPYLHRTIMDIQTIYQHTIKFAAGRHAAKQQAVPGTSLPYTVHLSNVAMEILVAAPHTIGFNTAFAVQVALLHDTLEDTETSFEELENTFGIHIARSVAALTKDENIPKEARMADSLRRIQQLPYEVWAVKLADRITNLQRPPDNWSTEKRLAYRAEAQDILDELGSGNAYLAARLATQIKNYAAYLTT
jgi:guanosine-3',5'-bis(diphosphate) 3'-pyrophosphohydrolase